MKKLVINRSPWDVCGMWGNLFLGLHQPTGLQIAWLIMLVFIGSGCLQQLCCVLMTEPSSPTSFIQKIQIYHIKNKYKILDKLNLFFWAQEKHYNISVELGFRTTVIVTCFIQT